MNAFATSRLPNKKPRAKAASSRAPAPAKPKSGKSGKPVLTLPRLQGERMSRVDTAWLRMDSEQNLMQIVGVLVLEHRVPIESIRQRMKDRLCVYPRFVQRVVQDSAGAAWVHDEHFDIARHVVQETLPPVKATVARRSAASQTALQQRVADLCAEALDDRHPLWKVHVVDNYIDAEGREATALIMRFHHCIADGIALIAVMMSLVDGGAEPRQRQRHLAQTPEEWIAQALIRPLTHWSVKAMDWMGDGAAAALHWMSDPQAGVQSTVASAKLATQVMSDVAALALMKDDSATRLKGAITGRKHVAWCEPIPLDEVKAVGQALSCSVNDVLLSCVGGAISHYLQSKGDPVQGVHIRAMVPVNLRPLEQAYQLGNRFGLAPMVLPLDIPNPIERVLHIRRSMSELKGSLQPLLAFGVLALTGVMVKPVQDAILGLFSRKSTAVMTNVPGPKDKLKFCGSNMEQALFWVPQTGNVGIGVSILSYGGGVQMALISDTALCDEPEAIISRFAPEFEQLLWLSMMLPWGENEA